MSTQAQLEQRHSATWADLEAVLDSLESARFWRKRVDHPKLPELYMGVCEHLSLVRSRGYSALLERRLDSLAQRAYRQLYRRRSQFVRPFFRFILGGFPRLLRKHGALFALSCALLFGPFFICLTLFYVQPEWIFYVMEQDQVAQVEDMYLRGESAVFGNGRDEADNFQMFGFYIQNNISIDFRCFAGGVFYGLGSVFFLVFNGIHIGSIAGYLTEAGAGHAFWGFVAGHSAPELLGAAVSGSGGLLMGKALLMPGAHKRWHALVTVAPDALGLVAGAALMTFTAAILEGFWSPLDVPMAIKYAAASVVWTVTLSYLLLVGKRRSDAH